MTVSHPSPARRRARACLVLSLLAAGAGFAACSSSSSSKPTSHGDGGQGDAAAADAEEDAVFDVSTGPNDVTVYPEAPSMTAPDGCLYLGATCLDESMCCSAYCTDGGCSEMPKQM